MSKAKQQIRALAINSESFASDLKDLLNVFNKANIDHYKCGDVDLSEALAAATNALKDLTKRFEQLPTEAELIQAYRIERVEQKYN